MLFAPLIAVFKWIPLVGWLLGHIISFAALITALTVGSVFHLSTMSAAWIFYRPLFGLGLAAVVLILVGFLVEWGDPEKA